MQEGENGQSKSMKNEGSLFMDVPLLISHFFMSIVLDVYNTALPATYLNASYALKVKDN